VCVCVCVWGGGELIVFHARGSYEKGTRVAHFFSRKWFSTDHSFPVFVDILRTDEAPAQISQYYGSFNL